MMETNARNDEVERLLGVLSADELPIAEDPFAGFSEGDKNELAKRLACRFEPTLPGRLLVRLLLIQTGDNAAFTARVFLSHLRAPDPEARAQSLGGLARLGHPRVEDLALLSLRDESDAVLFLACSLLIPRATRDSCLRAVLSGLCTFHHGSESIPLTLQLLRSQGFGA
jgi:hypothetical protein